MEDGLIEVELPADYGPHKAGAKLRVDPVRAEWIRTHLPVSAKPDVAGEAASLPSTSAKGVTRV